MKKLVLIVSLIFVAASCQKENIVPNAPLAQQGTMKSCTASDPDGNGNHGGGVITMPSNEPTSTTATDPTTTPGDDGAITDPMKKKDKKDSK